MRFFSSEIVADAANIELKLHSTEEQRRCYLRDWFNGHVEDGGLGGLDPLPEDVPEDWAVTAIRCHVGRGVVLGEVMV